MQRLPLELRERRYQLSRGTRWNPAPPAVGGIPTQRIPDMREMHANLMRASRLQLRPHHRVRPKPLQDAVVRNRWSPITANGHSRPLAPVAADRFVDSATGRHDAHAQGNVVPLDLALGNRRYKC